MKNLEAGQLNSSCLKFIVICQTRCQLGLQSSDGLTDGGVTDPLPVTLTWLLAGGLSFWPCGSLHRVANNMAANLTHSKQSNCCLLLPYYLGYRDQYS